MREWYEAVFEQRVRTIPPSPFDVRNKAPRAARVMRTVTTGASGRLKYEKLLDIPGDPVVKVFECGAALLKSGRVFDVATKQPICTLSPAELNVAVVKADNYWLFGRASMGATVFFSVNTASKIREDLAFAMTGMNVVSSGNRLFVVSETALTEIKLMSFGSRPIVSAGMAWGLLGKSTKWFSAVGVMDSMGAKFIVLPFGDGSVAQITAPELRNMQVVAGKAGPRFASFIALDKQGQYQKLEFTFDREYRTYTVWTGLADGPDLNVAMLPKGVMATILKDGELIIFVPTSGVITRVDDREIATDMLLANYGDRVVYLQQNALWSVGMA